MFKLKLADELNGGVGLCIYAVFQITLLVYGTLSYDDDTQVMLSYVY